MTARDQGPDPEDIDVITHNGSRMYATAAALVGYVPEWSYALLKRAALAGVHHWVALNALLPLEDPERERR